MAKPDIATAWLKGNLSDKWVTAQKNDYYVGPDRLPVICDPHELRAYQEQIRIPRNGNKKASLRQRQKINSFLMDHRNVRQDHCLLFPNAHSGERAQVNFNGAYMDAARAMCILAHGAAPETGMIARHLCGNGHMSCVNPAHLVWGDQEQNVRDYELHRRRPAFMPDLTPDQVAAIRSDTRPANVIAVEMQIHSIVIRIVRGDTLAWP